MRHRVLAWTIAGAGALAIAWGLLGGGVEAPRVESPGIAPAGEGSAGTQLPEVPPPHAAPAPPLASDTAQAVERSPAARSLGALRNGRLAGRVVDDDGEPIAGARIRLAAMEPIDEGGDEAQKTLSSDVAGGFRLEGLGEGPFLLVANAEGRRAEVLRDLRPGADDLEIVLSAQSGIAGRVLDAETGAPVARFSVEAAGVGRFNRSRRLPRSFESEDGSFEISDLEGGQYVRAFTAEGFVPERVEPFWVRDSVMSRDVEVRLRSGLAVQGTVVDEDSGTPVAGAGVHHNSADNPWLLGRGEETESDGSFAIEGVTRGARLVVRHEEYVDVETEPLGLSGEKALSGLVIRLSRGGAVDGYARSEDGSTYEGGRAVAHTEVFRPVSGVQLLKSAEVDRSGYFLIRGLEPGRYRVEVRPPSTSAVDKGERRRRTLHAEAVVEARRTTRVEFGTREPEGCTVRGRVFRGGEAVVGARVEIRRERAGSAPRREWASDASDETGKDGSYEIRKVPAGEANLRVSKEGAGLSEAGWWSIQIPASGVVVFDAHLAGGEIRGSVTRASDGLPVAGAQVGVWKEEEPNRGTVPGGWVRTDDDGTYRVRGLGAAAYRVSVDAALYPGDPRTKDPLLASLAPQSRRRVQLAPDEVVAVDFALEAGGSVSVRVIGPSGVPLPGEHVILQPQEDRARTGVFKTGFADGSGVARMTGVPPGRFLAALVRPEYSSQPSDPFSVRPGEEVGIRLELKQPVALRLRVLGPGDAPVEGAWVAIAGTAPDRTRAAGLHSDRNGGVVAHMLPGEYAVTASADGLASSSTTIRVGPDSTEEIVVRLDRAK